MRRALDNATQAELLRFKAADAVSTQGAGKITIYKITIYEKNGEHRASFDITGSYVLTLRQPPKDASHGKRPRW
jgi:hypothetical protein